MVWGGRHLGERLGKVLPPGVPVGESWEISAHPLHVSRVAEGPLQGALLTDLCATHAKDLFGEQNTPGARFPLLIKFLDCCDLLSIQVHPSDEQAVRLSQEKSGKTEAWIILEVQPTGRIFAGLKAGITRADLERHLAAGTLEKCLHSFTPRPGDCIFLPAGTVHAVGGGIVLAEIQQNSDATFRLFDWNRLGSDGKPRPLHIQESLESIDWKAGPVQPVTRGEGAGTRGEWLVHCRYFALQRFEVHDPFDLPNFGRLSIWLVLAGEAELGSAGPEYRRTFRTGHTVLVPATSPRLAWKPSCPAVLLGVTLG
jgi:mannose-6-phosphate isomerase